MTSPPGRYATGKRPAQPARPHLRLSAALTGPLPAPPSAVDYSHVSTWGMLGNADVGDCVEAYMGHAVEQATAYTSIEQSVSDSATIALYSAITGYNPNDPGTDQGTLMQDAFSFWRKRGIFGGHVIAAYAAVALTDWAEIGNAVDLFGHVALGFNFPQSAMDQFNAGEPWTVVPGSPLEGGHCVMLVGYDPDWLYVVTWGRVQKMARAFWEKYTDEAWVVVTRDTITVQGANAFGGVLDLAALGAAFAALTGDPNPFLGPTPVPPAPSPVPVIDGADQRLYDSPVIRRIMDGHFVTSHSLHRVLSTWEREKGF
jgi:hypothetical protein